MGGEKVQPFSLANFAAGQLLTAPPPRRLRDVGLLRPSRTLRTIQSILHPPALYRMPDPTNLLTLETAILPVLTQRRSPRAYAADRPVSPEALRQVFAAASSAASCFGEQPWRYLVGSRASSPAAYEKILGSLAEFNQAWARNAPVLAVSIAKL